MVSLPAVSDVRQGRRFGAFPDPTTPHGGEALIRFTGGARAVPNHPADAPKRLSRAARLALPAIVPLLVFAAASLAQAQGIATVMPPDGLNLRAAPGTQYPVLDLIPGGTRIGLTGAVSEAGWYPVVYQGKRGWVRGEFIDLPPDAAALTRRAIVRSSEGAVLRDEPYAGGVRVGQAANGAVVTASVRGTSDGWLLVAHAGQTGWMAAELLQIEGELALARPGATPLASIMSAVAPGTTTVRSTITYYHPSLEGGAMACGGRYRMDDPTIAAATSWPCGTRLRVCYNANCVVVTVQDTGHLGPNWVDLSTAAFRQLAPLAEMLITGSTEVLPPP